MNILAWMNKVGHRASNQIGSDTTAEQTQEDLRRWQQATQSFQSVVRDVLVLMLTRSWWHERKMMQSIAPLLPQSKQSAHQRLLAQRALLQQQRAGEPGGHGRSADSCRSA